MKNIFFDLDNTLTNRKLTIDAYAKYFLDEFKPSLISDLSLDFLAKQFNLLDKGGYQTHQKRSENIAELNIWQSTSKPKPKAECLSKHWQDWIPNNSMPMQGMKKCLQSFKNKGYRLCLVSNGQSKNQRLKIKHLDIEKYFDKIIISGEVKIEKPDAKIFQLALKEMNCNAQDAFFVGDHPINDVIASRQLGFTSIWMEGFHVWPEGIVKPLSIKSLSELKKWF